LTTGAGLIVSAKLVLVDKLPGSVAITVIETGDPTVVLGVPEIVPGAVKINPVGRPTTDSVSWFGV